MRRCKRCDAFKLLEAFPRDAKSAGGRRFVCKACRAPYLREAARRWRKTPGGQARRRAYNARTKEKRNAQRQARRLQVKKLLQGELEPLDATPASLCKAERFVRDEAARLRARRTGRGPMR